jgi:hypothetical protein
MLIPRWVFWVVGGMVLLFGAYRLQVAIRSRNLREDSPALRRKGMWGRSTRAHMLYGILYLILGSYLVAMGFGWGVNVRSMIFGDPSPGDAPEQTEPASD